MKRILPVLFLCLSCSLTNAQYKTILFTHVEYQFFNYSFLTAGIGYSPKGLKLDGSDPNHFKYACAGFTFNYSRALKNNDWGSSVQFCIYPGDKEESING